MDRVAFVFERSSSSGEPDMVILLEDGSLRCVAPKGGKYSDTATRLNSRCMALSPEDADEAFDDLVARYDGQSTLAQDTEYTGKAARRYATLAQKWGVRS